MCRHIKFKILWQPYLWTKLTLFIRIVQMLIINLSGWPSQPAALRLQKWNPNNRPYVNSVIWKSSIITVRRFDCTQNRRWNQNRIWAISFFQQNHIHGSEVVPNLWFFFWSKMIFSIFRFWFRDLYHLIQWTSVLPPIINLS